MTPHQNGPHTVLTGSLDQAALHGVLAEIAALGLVLVEVRRVQPRETSLDSGDMRSP
jgi:hypothetical protein